MTSPESESMLAAMEATISTLMQTALEMIADTVDAPQMDLPRYERYVTVAESAGPAFTLALIRCGAGLAAISDMTGDDVRSVATE